MGLFYLWLGSMILGNSRFVIAILFILLDKLSFKVKHVNPEYRT